MKLIFLYGAPAVGKLTIAKELAQLLDVPLVDNHSIVNPIARVFGWGHPEQQRLAHEFRVEFFGTAAREGKSIITTSGGGGEYYDYFIKAVLESVRKNGGDVIFIHLIAPKEVLLERVTHQSRVEKFTIAKKEKLLEIFENNPDVFARALVPEHFEIDTSLQAPQESAQMIVNAIRAQYPHEQWR